MHLTKNLQETLNAHLQSFGIRELHPTVSKRLINEAEAKGSDIMKKAEERALKVSSAFIKGLSLKRIFKELEEVNRQVPKEDTSLKPEETSGKSEGASVPSKVVSTATGGAPALKTECGHQLGTTSSRA